MYGVGVGSRWEFGLVGLVGYWRGNVARLWFLGLVLVRLLLGSGFVGLGCDFLVVVVVGFGGRWFQILEGFWCWD